MKQLLITLLLFNFSTTRTIAQATETEQIGIEVFNLLKLKQKFEERPNSASANKSVYASELKKSKYGTAFSIMKKEPKRYIRYIDSLVAQNPKRLLEQYVDFKPKRTWESRPADYYFITQLDFLQLVKLSLQEPKNDELLPLNKVPGIKQRYPARDIAVNTPK